MFCALAISVASCSTDVDLYADQEDIPVIYGLLDFSNAAVGTRLPFYFHPAINASIYTVDMTFTYKERRTPDSDTIPHTVMWHIGTYFENELVNQIYEDSYVFYYRAENFHRTLQDFIGADTAVPGLKRFITEYPATVIITAGGAILISQPSKAQKACFRRR